MSLIKCKCQNVIADWEDSGFYGIKTKDLLTEEFVKGKHQKVFVDLPLHLYCKYHPTSLSSPIFIDSITNNLIKCPICKKTVASRANGNDATKIRIDVECVNKVYVNQKKNMQCNQCRERYDLNVSGNVEPSLLDEPEIEYPDY